MSPAAKLNIISACHVLYCACTARRAWDEKIASASTQQSDPVPWLKSQDFKKYPVSFFQSIRGREKQFSGTSFQEQLVQRTDEAV